jgi:hypothetical protein
VTPILGSAPRTSCPRAIPVGKVDLFGRPVRSSLCMTRQQIEHEREVRACLIGEIRSFVPIGYGREVRGCWFSPVMRSRTSRTPPSSIAACAENGSAANLGRNHAAGRARPPILSRNRAKLGYSRRNTRMMNVRIPLPTASIWSSYKHFQSILFLLISLLAGHRSITPSQPPTWIACQMGLCYEYGARDGEVSFARLWSGKALYYLDIRFFMFQGAQSRAPIRVVPMLAFV